MQQNEELLIKIYGFANYIVKRFNEDFQNNPYGLVLQIRKLEYRKGYNLYFNSKEFYFDVNLIAERTTKDKNFKLFLGTVDVFYLGDEATENEYYFQFLRIINKLFKTQSNRKNIYYFEFPKMIKILTNELSKYDKRGYIQESLPV